MKKERSYDLREDSGRFEIWERRREDNPTRNVHRRVSVFDTRAEAEQEIERLRDQTLH